MLGMSLENPQPPGTPGSQGKALESQTPQTALALNASVGVLCVLGGE
jgi:hypothetical protein